ncbi:amidohydrolase family protein [Mucilaginibacter sp. 14171R-50]|uniref:amidohydrolase family protein n=1 Tax=Mucilaginibacter sp. 14171R-50 TaxID=2703789 RepID=UPI00138DCA34|nr:amidohydrolase family protein [Mucilaginibacter sp. 14171R-50]QHS54513.1 amidohydrolase family protein [Mucilaginibacter sp. 14171R-50]
MRKIDSHQHFWTFDAERHAWIDDSMQAIQKDFLPGQLQPILQQNGIEGCITVQVEQTEAENDLMLSLAENNSFIKGIVGWIEMAADRVEERLQYYSTVKLIKGFRHILQGEADDKFMLNPNFMRGIGLLNKYNFSYDILIKPNQLPYALQFASAFPDQRFVIDHLAKPYIKEKRITGWKTDMQAIAALPNVCCKISGMVTEADWLNWQPKDFTPYLEVVFEAFGAQRVMYGSDWPVCNVAGGYNGVLAVIDNYVSRLSQDEQEAFWAKNAEDFYRL